MTGEESAGLDKSKITDLVVMLLIAGMGLFTAYVCFGILNSHADTKMQSYSLQGAIAGALVSVSLLASVYLQFRKSSEEVEKLEKIIKETQHRGEERIEQLQKRNEELQQKIIRGAPHPAGFETEVDERQRIVLARPSEWQPRGGTLFDFQQPETKLNTEDMFPAVFMVSFAPITVDMEKQDAFYKSYSQSVESAAGIAGHTAEYIYLGGEPHSVKSLKVIAHHYAHVEIRKDAVTGKINRE